ncbi:MAG: AI-2E family transporter [Bryobacteraceae bacterium]
MTPQSSDQGWFTRERILTFALAMATLLALYFCYLLVKPFIPAVAFALALAVATNRPYLWLENRIQKESVAAALAVVLVALLILGPAAFLVTYAVQEAIESVNELRAAGGLSDWRSTIGRQPQLGALLSWAEQRLDIQAQFQRIGEGIAGAGAGFLRGSVAVITQLVITLFVLFFLFRDRKLALKSLQRLIPLSSAETSRMFTSVGNTIRATVNGSITVAFVQAVLGGIMYVVLGVPGAVLWAAATFLAALVPVFGTVLVWGPVAVYLLLTGSWIKAVILIGWGIVAVGTIDNVLYPWLVGDKLRLHTVPTFFAILGGITLFGPAGIILGPLGLAVTIGLLDVWWQRTAAGRSADEEVAKSDRAPSPPGAVLHERGAQS